MAEAGIFSGALSSAPIGREKRVRLLVLLSFKLRRGEVLGLIPCGAAAADAIAGDAELDALLNQYQASAPPAPAGGAAAFGRSAGGFDMQALLGGRQLPPGMNLMDFITPQDRCFIQYLTMSLFVCRIEFYTV